MLVIDERKIKILQVIINDYITTGEPVGSRTIAKKYELGVSPATIRNEMADLEELGYLEQPHTSAGRIPSSKGYRLYVDKLMKQQQLSLEEQLAIKNEIIDMALLEVDKMVKQVSSLLSDLTKLTCVAKTPSFNKGYIKSLQLMIIDENNILVVIITDRGVKNSIIKVKNIPSSNEIENINHVLNMRLKNHTIEQINLQVINSIRDDLTGYDDIFNPLIKVLYETLNNGNENDDVVTEGTTNIFNYPEYNDIESAKEILSLLEDKGKISALLDNKDGFSIRIGDENYLPGAKNCSVISAVYFMDDVPLGTIGLIGPRRINYSKVVSIMAEVMKELNEVINKKKL
ncbi:MAG: heat-inducible transcriptional repressor HrcA [Inconstantimicrobium porci]|nr:heat-inducible transcriptional repressor HrcA [Inconstantimicrobium porci]MDD6771228.1 heat-inducible transcriptional repressor HrcA [Inconstantimicrobium porci]MDY5912211.1 heat-inducible transcriptional repressor HrcA [Inconstantimicrobium porci]